MDITNKTRVPDENLVELINRGDGHPVVYLESEQECCPGPVPDCTCGWWLGFLPETSHSGYAMGLIRVNGLVVEGSVYHWHHL